LRLRKGKCCGSPEGQVKVKAKVEGIREIKSEE
jgi:hypothetical protein